LTQNDAESRHVKPCWLGPMSIEVGPIQFLAKSARSMSSELDPSQCRVDLSRVDVERTRPRSMSSGLIPSLCRAESARVDVEWTYLGSMSSGINLGRLISIEIVMGRIKSEFARVDVDRSWHGTMLTGDDPGRNRPASAWFDFKSQPRPMSKCHPDSVSSRVNLGQYRAETAHAKIDQLRFESIFEVGLG